MGNLIKEYDYIVIDNEAGLEHLSRRTTRSLNALVVVSDATVVGLKAAKRIGELTKALKIETGKELLLINRHNKELEETKVEGVQLNFLGCLPVDREIEKISLNGNSMMGLSNKASSLFALRRIGEKIWQRS